jgi:hypothetical protein
MTRPLIAAAAFLIALFAAVPATAQTLQPAPENDENLQWAASVVQINDVPNQPSLSVKLFGVAGGDPAMNGLQTYIGFFAGPGDGWRVFQIGDFLSYRILSATAGRVNLQIQDNTINSEGVIGTRTRRVFLRWTPGRGGDERPATVTMARMR